jgi:hypothetical protein
MTKPQADPPATPMTVRDVLLLMLQADFGSEETL